MAVAQALSPEMNTCTKHLALELELEEGTKPESVLIINEVSLEEAKEEVDYNDSSFEPCLANKRTQKARAKHS